MITHNPQAPYALIGKAHPDGFVRKVVDTSDADVLKAHNEHYPHYQTFSQHSTRKAAYAASEAMGHKRQVAA